MNFLIYRSLGLKVTPYWPGVDVGLLVIAVMVQEGWTAGAAAVADCSMNSVTRLSTVSDSIFHAGYLLLLLIA